jgi:hypothetical protein
MAFLPTSLAWWLIPMALLCQLMSQQLLLQELIILLHLPLLTKLTSNLSNIGHHLRDTPRLLFQSLP